jgi:hypothetical protein
MTRIVLLALGLLAIAVFSRADQLFDGTLEMPAIKFQPSPKIKTSPTKQDGKDLYYFTPAEAKEAAKRFKFRAKSTGGWTFDADVPQDIQDQMRADLAFMAGVQGSGVSPLHQQIFGSVDGAAYKQWFDSRVTAIGLNDCGSPIAAACVIPFMDPSKMWLTPNFVKFDHPQISRIMVVYHEARHTETQNGNWPHANCPDPFKNANGEDIRGKWSGALLAGEPACDTTVMGSYGSSVILLKNIEKHCANCTDKVKMDAGIYADDQVQRMIDPDARRQMDEDFQK